jgi:hypothetical protein
MNDNIEAWILSYECGKALFLARLRRKEPKEMGTKNLNNTAIYR